MPNIFVLCSGRCGSTTFSKAASHATNYSSGHETRTPLIGSDRLAYPNHHIEADNRLTWMLGRLEREWGDRALYVHLQRERNATARSFAARSAKGIMRAYREDILLGSRKYRKKVSDFDYALDYIDTVNANIETFLARRSNHFRVQLETATRDFEEFWNWAGLEGDLGAALNEWKTSYNATK
ncbi:hypothetical protein [Paracoccus sp. SCSIO 75233]|uniref:hypothetical protein n=1 Tax=Paracoccus sp. SCSIO 75233 TaxID=3017782 RepID=UPI0022F045B8|nr:hypothetical protein [Paracoccus sp. SCSIO 75233]WBU52289.1 hypothetical protein PAF12_10640 [Paracoccus sp. SCSIO 75233]